MRAAQLDADFAKEDARPRQFWDPERAADTLTAAKADIKAAVEILKAAEHPIDAGIAALVRSLAERGKRLRTLTENAAKERRDKLGGFFAREADRGDASATRTPAAAAAGADAGAAQLGAVSTTTAADKADASTDDADLPPLV